MADHWHSTVTTERNCRTCMTQKAVAWAQKNADAGTQNTACRSQGCESSAESAMSDERLDQIEGVMSVVTDRWVKSVVGDLIAEVRRLKREVALLNLSRGAPSIVGGD